MNVIILRGIPGSGKSAWCKRQKLAYLHHLPSYDVSVQPEPGKRLAFICSADDFHMADGEYRYDPKNAQEAHAACVRNFLRAIRSWIDTVIVDNTNSRAWEIAPYWQVATAMGFRPRIIRMLCEFERAFRRQSHGVPAEVAFKMHRAMIHEELPPHWREEFCFTNTFSSADDEPTA